MSKAAESIIAWSVAGLLVMSAVTGLAIADILVSLKYETNNSEACISQVTHQNLCWQLHLTQGLCAGSLTLALLITLVAWWRNTDT
jgi:hypothetical protein